MLYAACYWIRVFFFKVRLMANQIKERRFLSESQLTREQALWLCRAIWTHYRSDRNASDVQRDQFDIFNRTDNRSQFQRGDRRAGQEQTSCGSRAIFSRYPRRVAKQPGHGALAKDGAARAGDGQ